jgi:uncharacterized protein YndB with AHSA1/START domain/DNA-binding transcriptional ArsR family regulator
MREITTDDVFRALADPNRRLMLDLLKANSGLTVGGVAESFEFTRFAVMKHLRVLEDAGLVVRRRMGRNKRLYINVVPIQLIYDRWISRYSALWAARLTSLKHELEKEDRTMQATNLDQIHVVYIRTTPQKLWEALTRPEFTRQYFHGTDVKSDLQVGSTIEYLKQTEEGGTRSALSGEILEIAPGSRLVHTFSFPSMEEKPTKVTYEIEPVGAETVKLTVTHEGFEGETETYKMVRGGWPPILSGLKSLLETGRPLQIGGE